MDLKKFAEFIDYKPVHTIEEVDKIVKGIQKRASVYLNDKKLSRIWDAYIYARDAHDGVMRQSGEPYISHTVLTAKILMDINPGLPAIQAALLHDVIEDTPLTKEDIEENFGEEVAFLCTGLEKVAKVKYSGEDRHLETLKKTFLAMGQDLRVIFIKIADRIHNIQTLHYHPQKKKQIKIAEETLKIYVPIAQRLGFGIFQGFLEDGSFRIINPEEFERIYSFIKNRFKGIDKDIEEIDVNLKKIADESNIPYYSIRGRVKGLYRIYLKLDKYQTHDISDIKDIVAFRFVTDSVENCYSILGNIHKYYTPVIKKIKDYIAVPKNNGYQSIHTTVLGLYKHPIEIQIRTKGMDEIARYGVAAHFFYKEKGKSEILDGSQSKWIRNLQDMVKMYQNAGDNEEFKKMLNIDFLRKNIFVYTPGGDIIELPKGATVLDFAFRIHTDIGLKFKIGTVNGNVCPISKKLKTGDIVSVKNYKNKNTANKGRLRFLESPSSKEKVNKFLKSIDKKIYIEIGKEMLNIQLDKLGLAKFGHPKDKIKKSFQKEEIEKLLIQISNRTYSARRLINRIYPEMKPSPERRGSVAVNIDHNTQDESQVIIDDTTLFEYDFCAECIPSEKDQIIGRLGRNSTKIHTTGCKALTKINFSKLVEAHWDKQEKTPYIISFDFDIKDKPGMLIKILTIFREYDINIVGITVGETVHNAIHITGEFNNPTTVDFIIKDLKKLAVVTTKILVSIQAQKV